MSKLLDMIHELSQRTQGRYIVTSEYLGYNKPIAVNCTKHNQQFLIVAERLLKFYQDSGSILEGCSECKKEFRDKNRITVPCAYCGKPIERPKSWLNETKSGLAFCCVEHKHKAQTLEFGLSEIHPDHYGKSKDYRAIAFKLYKPECVVCGWKEDIRILEVHHRDLDHNNNDGDNLAILCPICHAKISRCLYMLVEDELVPVTEAYREDFYKKTKYRSQTGKKVHCIEDDMTFNSISECGRYYGISNTTIHSVLNKHGGKYQKLEKSFVLIE